MDPFNRLPGEQLLQLLLPVAEDPFDVATHEEPVNPGATTREEAHMVQAEGAAVAFLEGVGRMLLKSGFDAAGPCGAPAPEGFEQGETTGGSEESCQQG